MWFDGQFYNAAQLISTVSRQWPAVDTRASERAHRVRVQGARPTFGWRRARIMGIFRPFHRFFPHVTYEEFEEKKQREHDARMLACTELDAKLDKHPYRDYIPHA